MIAPDTEIKNFSNTFYLPLQQVHLDLINACSYILHDDGGTFVYKAVSFDDEGNVTFKKEYHGKN